MIKLVGSALIVMASAGVVSYVISGEKKKIEEVDAFIALIKYVRNQIDCFSMPIEKILASCPELVSKIGVSEKTTSISGLVSKCDISCQECKKIINAFSLSLGKGYREQEIRLCEKVIGELENIKKGLECSYPSRKRTTVALCLAIGGALLIALL